MGYKLKIGKFAYYALMLHSDPEAAKHMCMVVQLGYEPIQAARRSNFFNSINVISTSIQNIVIDDDEQLKAAMEDNIKAIQENNAVMVVFQAQQVTYQQEQENENGVRVKVQESVEKGGYLFGTVAGVVEREGPLCSYERGKYLSEEINKLVGSSET